MSFGQVQIKLKENTLEKIGRIFAVEYGVKMIFRHDYCMTDGRNIYLPVIPNNASDEFLEAIEGFLDHEVSHILHSDFEVVKAASEMGRKHRMITNALEDCRIEEEMMKVWRGTRVNLHNCREWSLKNLTKRWEELSDFGKLVSSIATVPAVEKDHWYVTEVLQPETEMWEKLDKIKHLIEDACTLKSSQECLDRAIEIMKLLEEEDEEDTEMQGNGSEKEKRKVKSASGSSSEEGEGETDEELENDENILSKHNQVKQEAKSNLVNSNLVPDRYLIYSTEDDVIEHITDGDKEECQRFLAESRTITNALRQKFRLNLLTRTKDRWATQKRRGKVNPKAVFRVPIGTSKAIFRQKIIAPTFNTRCSLWIDHSDSMNGTSINLAAKAALIFGECLNEIGIPFEVCGYSTTEHYSGIRKYEAATAEEKELFTRWGSLWIGVYKGFDEAWTSVRHRCINMVRNSKYNTYDGETLRIAALRLMQHPEKRKILFTLNDGYPCPNVFQFMPEHRAYLKEVAPEVEKAVEVFAVGIRSDAVTEFYNNSVEIDRVQDLPTIMLSELDRLLRKGQNAYSRG